MDWDKYLRYPDVSGGEIMTEVFHDLYKWKRFRDVLVIRTPTTGGFMDSIVLDKDTNVVKIVYDRHDPMHGRVYDRLHRSGARFDVVCIDPWHEYGKSATDLEEASSLLRDDGILLCHDCYPPRREWAQPKYRAGSWCGVTYIAFVGLALRHPDRYYGVIPNDTGVGIMSKRLIPPLRNGFDTKKQEELIRLRDDDCAYEYFVRHASELMNILS